MKRPGNIIRQIYDVIYRWVRPNIDNFLGLQKPKLWALALVAGLAGALVAMAFRLLIGLIQWMWSGTHAEVFLDNVAQLPWWMVVMAPTLGGLVVGIILYWWGPSSRAGGVSDIIEERARDTSELNLRNATLGTLISAITLGSGGSAGREGPVVYYAATVAKALFEAFELPPSARRTMLACGVAAAISASFNAPIAGVLFAHEVILGHFSMMAFVPLVIAAVLAAIIVQAVFGQAPVFFLPDFEITSFSEVPAFAILGIVCAVVAILFQASLIGSDWINTRLSLPTIARPAIGGFIVGLIALAFPQVLGVGYEATDAALSGQLGLGLMLALIVAKTLATAATFGSRLGGGVFSPSLYLGAMTGGAFGLMVAQIAPELASNEGLYAVVGMAAVAAAVLGAPVSTAMMVYELTDGFSFSIALLLTIAIATGLSQAAMGRSFFFWQLFSRGVMLEDGPHTHLARQMKVASFCVPLKQGEEKPPIDPDCPCLKQGDKLSTALKSFADSGETRLLVVGGKDNQPIGWAYHVDALSHYNEALVAKSREEHH